MSNPYTELKGSIVALITPFKNDKVDENALKNLIEWHIASGTHGIVAVGTTGESPTLDYSEHHNVIDIVVDLAKGKIPVIAGTGSNSTDEAIALTRFAEKAGADYALIVTPYYNKPTQEGLFQHFKTIHNSTTIPIILYNVPGRSVVDLSVETVARLSELPRIIAIKDATGKIERISMQRHLCGIDFIQLSGEDGVALAANAHGAIGCISVTANVAPHECALFQEATLRGDYKTALEYQDLLMPLHNALFLEPNPVPAKYALSLLGKCNEDVRLPLYILKEETKQTIKEAMIHAKLL